MNDGRDAVPKDLAIPKRGAPVEHAKGLEIATELAVARAKASEDEAPIARSSKAKRTRIRGFARKRTERKPFLNHFPRGTGSH
ncbi:hypothetical protein IVB35_15185 [Bradyrhizobium sp. 30]|nr:hypothetical protein [Bradyrhizobium sp. 30]